MTRKEHEEMQRKKGRKKKKRSLRLYALLVIVLGIAILSLSVVLLFKVQKIEISGNEYCSDKEIREMIQDDSYSVNALYIFGEYLTGHGQKLPCFESVKVSLKAPWIVKVSVREKPIVGYMSGDKEYLYFDKDGLIVKKSNEILEGVPLVEGITPDNTELYKPLKNKKSIVFEEILETTKELNKYDLKIKKIVCKNDRIYVYIGKVCVSLGDTVTPEKIAQIPPIMDKLGKQKGTLHLENYSEARKTITFNKGEFPKEN